MTTPKRRKINSIDEFLTPNNAKPTLKVNELRDGQVHNLTGGAAYELPLVERALQWAINGSEDNAYYATARELTLQNATSFKEVLKSALMSMALLEGLVKIAKDHRAPKQVYIQYMTAYLLSSNYSNVRRATGNNLNTLAKTPTALIEVLKYIKQNKLRGWGRTLREAIQSWFFNKSVKELSLHVVKYRRRGGKQDGWDVRDLAAKVRLSHAAKGARLGESTETKVRVFEWLRDPNTYTIGSDQDLALLDGYLKVSEFQTASDFAENEIIKVINTTNVPWETLPTWALRSVKVWKALLPTTGYEALLRNLGRLTNIGLFDDHAWKKTVIDLLTNADRIKNSKIHPFKVLEARTKYRAGNAGGKLTWKPVDQIASALNEAYKTAIANVKPTDKRVAYVADVSGSMSTAIAQIGLTMRDLAFSYMTIMAEVEHIADASGYWFGTNMLEVPASALRNSAEFEALVKAKANKIGYGTDGAQVLRHMINNRVFNDAAVFFTDGQINQGENFEHVLEEYRRKVNKDFKCVVVNLAGYAHTLNDLKNKNNLHVFGYDSALMTIINDFIRGEVSNETYDGAEETVEPTEE